MDSSQNFICHLTLTKLPITPPQHTHKLVNHSGFQSHWWLALLQSTDQKFLKDWVALFSQYTTILVNGHRPSWGRLRGRIKYIHMMLLQGYSPRRAAGSPLFMRPWVCKLAIMVTQARPLVTSLCRRNRTLVTCPSPLCGRTHGQTKPFCSPLWLCCLLQ